MDKKDELDYLEKEELKNITKDDVFKEKEDYSSKNDIIENMDKKDDLDYPRKEELQNAIKDGVSKR